MRIWILILALSLTAFAQEPNTDLLRAEIEALRAQLVVVQQKLEIAGWPQVMRAKLAEIDTSAKLEAAQKKASSDKPEPPKPEQTK